MKTLFYCLALAGLSGCASTVIAPDGSKMSETIYAHSLSVQAYQRTADASEKIADATVSCYARATTELGLAICGLSGRSGQAPQSAQVPTYQAPPTFIDRVVQFAPLALGLGQIVASDRANTRQTDAGVQMAAIGARRELGIVQAATGSNERIATGGFNAVGNIAQTGFNALGNAAQTASASSAFNAQAWAGALASMPPTTQIIAGRDVIQARDLDQSFTAGDRIRGDNNRLRNNVNCTATGGNGAPATAGNQSATGGNSATIGPPSPLTATYNPLISGGDGAQGANNCGGG